MPRFRTSSTMMSFPQFTGVTRKLVIANVGCLFALLLLRYLAPHVASQLLAYLSLVPAFLVHGWIWQLVTYGFVSMGILNVAFNMLTFWFIGAYLESAKGSRWLLEIYFLCLIGGGLIGSVLTFTHLFHASPMSITAGADAPVLGVLAAFGALFGDLEMFMFPLPVAIKARYLVTVVILIDVALTISGGAPLVYFTMLAGALLGFTYAKRAPRRGVGTVFSDRYFDLRNNYYRWKRRRAARKFEVYMRSQNRDVRFDSEGRYIDPDEKRDPNDRKWMN